MKKTHEKEVQAMFAELGPEQTTVKLVQVSNLLATIQSRTRSPEILRELRKVRVREASRLIASSASS